MFRPSTTPALTSNRFASALSTALSSVLDGYEPLFRAVEAVAFWAAVALPFVYLPLVVTGVETPSEGIAVAALVALHVVALVAGRRYRAAG